MIRMRSCPVSAVSSQLIFLLYRHLRHALSGNTAIQMGNILLECFLLSAFRHRGIKIPHGTGYDLTIFSTMFFIMVKVVFSTLPLSSIACGMWECVQNTPSAPASTALSTT